MIPAYRANQQWGLLRGVLQYAERRGAAAAGVICLAGPVLVWFMGGGPHSELALTFFIGFALVPIWAMLWVTSSAVRAFGGVVSALAPDRIVRDGALVLLLVCLWAGAGINFDARGVMFLTMLSSLTGLVIVRVTLGRWRSTMAVSAAPEYAAVQWRRIAVPLVSISVAETLLNRTGVVLLGWSGHTTEAGIYALVFNLAAVVVLPRVAINALYAPLVADLTVRGDRAALQYATTRTGVWTFVSALCIAAPVIVLADWLLAWFGPNFGQGAAAMCILLVGQAVSASFGSQMFLITMTGHEYWAAALLIDSEYSDRSRNDSNGDRSKCTLITDGQ